LIRPSFNAADGSASTEDAVYSPFAALASPVDDVDPPPEPVELVLLLELEELALLGADARLAEADDCKLKLC
jgi:hypothetical protein